MVFSSLTFIFIFLPIFFAVYFLTPSGHKNAVLLLGSLVFYWYGVKEQPLYLILLLASVAANYWFGLQIGEQDSDSGKKGWLTAGLIYNFGWLILFKYAGFIIENINRLTAFLPEMKTISEFHPLLPLGISFYTFQITSYLIDVYRKKTEPETSILNLGAYLCMFPHITSGPIDTYRSLASQFRERSHSMVQIEEGLRTFTIGLGLKVLLANSFGSFWSDLNTIGFDSLSTPLAWLGIAGYSLQLYFDFYGYSLMAMGLGQMMGFSIAVNFKHPYMACSMTDFWRRWHITLGAWFREYIYIPLGGNRCKASRQTLNMLAVWLLTGFWHGASWNFILWGGILFLIMFVEKQGLLKVLDKHSWFGHIYMCFFIPFTWLFFAITDFAQLRMYLGRLFPFFDAGTGAAFAGDFEKYISMYGVTFLTGLIFSTEWPRRIYEKHKNNFLILLALIAVFVACVYCMYLGMDDTFLYYQF